MKSRNFIILIFLILNSVFTNCEQTNKPANINLDSIVLSLEFKNLTKKYKGFLITPVARGGEYISIGNSNYEKAFYNYFDSCPNSLKMRYTDSNQRDTIDKFIHYNHSIIKEMINNNIVRLHSKPDCFYDLYYLSLYDSTFEQIKKSNTKYYDNFANDIQKDLSKKEKLGNIQYRYVLVNIYSDSLDLKQFEQLKRIRPLYKINKNWYYYRTYEFCSYDKITTFIQRE